MPDILHTFISIKKNKTTATSAIEKLLPGFDGSVTPIDLILHRDKGCWLNDVLKICAYDKATAPDEIRNKNESVEQIRDYFEVNEDGNNISSLQKRLSELGYYKGNLDNIWGSLMYKALEEAIANLNQENTLIASKDKNAVPKFLEAISNSVSEEQFAIEAKAPEMADLEKEELTEADVDIIESREAIRLAGIDLGMSELLQRKILTRDGYVCQDSILKNVIPTLCRKGDATIGLKPDQIEFNCQNFNVCHLSFKELAEDLVNNNIVEDMQYDTSSYVQAKILTYVETYCGRGNAGDSLCVEKETQASGHVGQNSLILKRGSLGKGGISYN